MKFRTTLLFAAVLCLLLLYSCRKDDYDQAVPEQPATNPPQQNDGDVIPSKYIVILKADLLPDLSQIPVYDERSERMMNEVRNVLRKNNLNDITAERVYHTAIKGFSCALNPQQLEQLKKDAAVEFIEADKVISLGPQNGNTTVQPVQKVPYGITRVGWTTSYDGTGKFAWIIDTGVDLLHPDLNVDALRSKSFLLSGKNYKSPTDENGHGTHVAGTIAAKDNSIGVVGVAADAFVVSVRVLGSNGSGTVSGVINGVDYVASMAKTGDVANMSLGGSASSALDKAVLSASQKGIYFAIAAGNSSANAGNYSPARVNGSYVFTVSAMDEKDIWAGFSNYGNPPIDYCAPGVNILSTWKGGGYRTISGTSMAAPHVAGVLLMTKGLPKSDGTVKNDPDGNADPVAHL